MKEFQFPFYRYQITEKYYILLNTRLNKAEVVVVNKSNVINDFLLWHRFKTIKTFFADTPRKAYFKAKRWILRKEARNKKWSLIFWRVKNE